MRNVECCDRCNKFTMVGIDNGSALLFAHQWCKCSDERENVMSDNARNTQFQSFADMVWDEIMRTMIEYGRHIDVGTDPAIYRKIIACRSYDLVKHALTYFDKVYGEFEDIEDMTELPKESS